MAGSGSHACGSAFRQQTQATCAPHNARRAQYGQQQQNKVMIMLDRVTHRLRSSRRLAISLQQHLDGAADWLAQAQDVSADDGVPAYYNAKTKRWAASYPETTGYIIPTLYRYAKLSGRAEFAERATRMAHW